MATESGYGYSGFPSPDNDYLREERDRDLEDYISRRLKAKVGQAASQTVAHGATVTVGWDTTPQYDTAGLWSPATKTFIIPEGGDGDYLITAKVFVWDYLTACPNGDSDWVDLTLLVNGSIVDFSTRRLSQNFYLGDVSVSAEESLRMGDSSFVQVINGSVTCAAQILNTEFSYFSIRRLL